MQEYNLIDMDLPSGTLWADRNIGAESPEDSGNFYAWAWPDRDVYYKNIDELTEVGIIDLNGNLTNKYDAAYIVSAGTLRMPTVEQCCELLENTVEGTAVINGITCCTFTSKKDSSKTIYIPLSGYESTGELDMVGTLGYLWTSSVCGDYHTSYYIGFSEEHPADIDSDDRFFGQPIRGVKN